MKRPAVSDSIRLVLWGLGICCFLLFAWFISVTRLATGVVEFRSEVIYGKTNSYFTAAYVRANGVHTHITDFDSVPAHSRPGDPVRVIYNPNSKGASVLSLKTVCTLPVVSGIAGMIFILLGLMLRSRRAVVVSEAHAAAS
jgi:hypothetical protein